MRRANYEGSIYRRSDGRWAAALMLNGRRRSVYGKTRQEVADRLRELQQQATRQGMLADPGRHTIADLLAAWLEAVAPILKPRSLDSYRQICDAHIRPTIGKVRLSRLTPDVIQRLITPLQQQGKARTAAKVYATLRRACRVAVLWGWLASNPCERLELPSLTPHGLRHLHASLLLSEGLPIPLVSRRLGHANAAVTMGIYAHCVSKRDDQAVQAISRALTGG